MAEHLRPLKCQHAQATAGACQEPPVYEVLGPVPCFFCKEHAQEWLDEGLEERWIQLGEGAYLAELMEIVDTLKDMANRSWTFREVCDDAMFYVERELWRARRAYIAVGGKPQPTKAEIDQAHAEMDFLSGPFLIHPTSDKVCSRKPGSSLPLRPGPIPLLERGTAS